MSSRLSYSTLGCLLLATCLTAAQQSPTNTSAQQQSDKQQTPEPAFRIEVNYVEEDVRVVDNVGNFVKGLGRDDFELIEDGKPQKVDVFELVDIPVIPVDRPAFADADAPPIDPDVASNLQGTEGRFYLILIDDYHISSIRTSQAKHLLRQFILEKLGANDQAAILFASGNAKNAQWFTHNRRLLLAAADQFTGTKLRTASLARLDPRARQLENPDDPNSFDPNDVQDLDAAERMYKARSSVSSLKNVVEWLSKIRGRRKAVIWLTEGVDYNAPDIFSGKMNSNYSRDEADVIQSGIRDVVFLASRHNVQVYPVDPRGMNSISQEDILVDNRYRLPELHIAGVSLEGELFNSQMNLRQTAEETGGIAITGTNDFAAGFDRLIQENSSYYVLGYYPTNDNYDGRLRSITVKVKGYPDAQVTYRKRYAAIKANDPSSRTAPTVDPAGTVEAQLTEAMVSPLPVTGLSMRMTAVPRRGSGKNANVAVLIDLAGRDLTFKEGGGTFSTTLSLSIGVVDRSGKWVTTQEPVVRLPLRPATHASVLRSGLRVITNLEVPAGQYQFRVAAQDAVGSKNGSVHLDVEVPDFSGYPLAISGVAVASTADLAVPTGTDPFRGLLPGPPTAIREFSPADELTAFVEIYDNQRTPPHGLDITTSIKASNGQVVFTDSAERHTSQPKGSSGAFNYSVRVPLLGWQPGLYVMAIEAKSRLSGVNPVSRTIQFKVR